MGAAQPGVTRQAWASVVALAVASAMSIAAFDEVGGLDEEIFAGHKASTDAACDSPPVTSDEIDLTSTGGRTYDIRLTSEDSGEPIAFSVFEPAVIASGESYPLVIQGHGFGATRARYPTGYAPNSGKAFGVPTGGLTGDMHEYVEAGFWVISFDQRGHADSGGSVRFQDPEHEGSDLVQMLDWAEANLPQLRYRPKEAGKAWPPGRGSGRDSHPVGPPATPGGGPRGDADCNVVLGTVGASYGGGFQLLLLTVDPKQRLDAIVPQITWNDLSYSLFPQDVPKSSYALALTAASTFNTRGRLHPFLLEQVIDAAQRGRPSDDFKRFLRYHSIAYHCAGETFDGVTDEGLPFRPAVTPPPVDALIVHGMHDTIFTYNEPWATYECLGRSGADVRFYGYQTGHIWPSGAGMFSPPPFEAAGCDSPASCQALFEEYQELFDSYAEQFQDGQATNTQLTCGPHDIPTLELTWMKAKLLEDAEAIEAVDALPETCLPLDSTGDAVTLDGLTIEPTVVEIPATNVTLNTVQAVPVPLPLTTVGETGVLAGMARLHVELSSPGPEGPDIPELGIDDPIVFVALARSRASFLHYCHEYADPYPFAPQIFCDPVEATVGDLTLPSHLEIIDDQVTPIRGLGTHELDLHGVGERLGAGEQLQLLVFGYHHLYSVTPSRQATELVLQLSGSVELPLYSDLPRLD